MNEPRHMSSRNAAEQILREAGSPLHAREITKRMLDRKLWEPQGKTPAATVSAQLYTEINKRGDRSRFVLTAPPDLRPARVRSATGRPRAIISRKAGVEVKAEVPGTRDDLLIHRRSREGAGDGWR